VQPLEKLPDNVLLRNHGQVHDHDVKVDFRQDRYCIRALPPRSDLNARVEAPSGIHR